MSCFLLIFNWWRLESSMATGARVVPIGEWWRRVRAGGRRWRSVQ